MSDKPLIPFWLYPFSWGLKGKAREIARANYELQGAALEHKLLDLEYPNTYSSKDYVAKYADLQLKYGHINAYQHGHKLANLIEDPKKKAIAIAKLDLSGYDLEKELLLINRDDYSTEGWQEANIKIEYKYGNLTDSEYMREIVNLIQDPVKKALGFLELDYKEGKIEFFKYDKEMHTLLGKPWVNVLKMDFAPGKPEEGAFELDWNEHFIKELENSGYLGKPDEMINLWFMTVCKNVALDTFGGVGTFDEDSELNLSSQPGELPPGRKIY